MIPQVQGGQGQARARAGQGQGQGWLLAGAGRRLIDDTALLGSGITQSLTEDC